MPKVRTEMPAAVALDSHTPISVSVRDVWKTFDTTPVLKNVSLDIRRGEFFSLLGPSGCGKTTLLRSIGGFETPTSGTIVIDGKDVAADLTARGHVFAESGLFSAYGRHEQDARNAKLGIWRGTSERPSEYRARLWETAKKTAPDGCPIKGHVSAGERVYVVPWSPTYGRVKVQADRGGRWFCSEQEAQAAGWKSVTRS